MLYLDAGTTYSKIITDRNCFDEQFLVCEKSGWFYYVLPSSIIKSMGVKPDVSCGHMSNANENEIIALAKGAQKLDIEQDATILAFLYHYANWRLFNANLSLHY